MITALLLGSLVPGKSHVVWLCLFGMGYALRSFKGFCLRYPPIPKRDPQATKAMIRWMLAMQKGGAR